MSTTHMRILLIGSIPLVSDVAKYQKLGYKDIAAYVSQKNIVKALELVVGHPIDIISAVNFPPDSVVDVPSFEDSNVNCIKCSVGYKNIKYLGLFNEERALRKAVQAWCKTVDRTEQATIIVYGMASRFLGAAEEAKKNLQNCSISLIVPDLPQYMFFGYQSLLRRILKKIDYHLILKRLACIDFFFLYTKYMAEALCLKNTKKWEVFEGIPDISVYDEVSNGKTLRKDFVMSYAGGLTKEANLEAFIKAVKMTKRTDVRFVIMGTGPEEQNIKKITSEFDFVDFRGMCNHSDVIKQLVSSDLLVIPRSTCFEYTKFSCPSKLLEYMGSGVPVVTTHLAGIPDDYIPHVFLFEDDSAEGMMRTLNKILSLPSDVLIEKGISARSFLEKEKSIEKAGHFLLTRSKEYR